MAAGAGAGKARAWRGLAAPPPPARTGTARAPGGDVKLIAAVVRTVWGLAVPGGLVIAAAFLVIREAPGKPWATWLELYPYVTLGLSAVLAWRFRHGRLLLAVAVVELAARGLDGAALGSTTYAAIASLLPLNLMALAFFPERALLSAPGIGRMLLIGAQVYVVRRLDEARFAPLAAWLERELVDDAWTAWTPLPQPALAAFALAAVIVTLCVVDRRGALEEGFFWALVASFAALDGRFGGTAAVSIWLATAELVLCAAIVERSHALAYDDELTRLPGRRALAEAFDRLPGKYAIAMVDIDHFKKLNDRYGHDVGDQVLRMVAARLGDVGGGGRPFRYGGEEFTLLFRRRTAADAASYLEDLRAAIADQPFAVRAPDRPTRKPRGKGKRAPATGGRTELKVTVSIGVAGPDAGRRTPDEVIKAADKALYKAKKGGRNRVVST